MFPFLPRTASAKDGSDITIRTVRPGDAEQIHEMTSLLAEAGEGIVRTVDEVPGNAEATAVGIRRWLRGRRCRLSSGFQVLNLQRYRLPNLPQLAVFSKYLHRIDDIVIALPWDAEQRVPKIQ